MPIDDDIPSIEVSPADGKENARPRKSHRWSRSPHPYHRQKERITDAALEIKDLTDRNDNKIPSTSSKTEGAREHNETQIRSSPSDSGTEADDESGVVLKGLPAPPVRWRKGLRSIDGKETASPLLTPSYLDDEDRRLALERQLRLYGGFKSPLSTDDETRKIRSKFKRRRRAELLRRVLETAILAFVGIVSYGCRK